MPELAAIIARLEPELGRLEGEPQPLEGGITNRNYRLRMGGEDLVLRLCDRGAEVLGIDRSTEEIASRRAAAEGIAPPVVAFLSDVPALVTRWLPGGDVAVEHMRTPGVMAQVAAMLRRLHATPALAERVRDLPAHRGAAPARRRPARQLRRASWACCTGSRRRPPAPSTSPSPATTTC